MNTLVRRKLDMASRVRGFLRAHPLTGTGDAAAVARLEELFTQGEELVARQRRGVVATRSATSHREKIRKELRTLLKYLSAVGVVAAKERADLAEQFRLPSSSFSHRAFVTAAKEMLARGGAVTDLLVSKGMSDALLTALGAAVSQFETTLEASQSGRRDHTGASALLRSVSKAISEQVAVLDGLVRFKFGSNDDVIRQWEGARNLAAPAQTSPEEPGTEGTSSPGDVAPAA
jgi:hypothetical protein